MSVVNRLWYLTYFEYFSQILETHLAFGTYCLNKAETKRYCYIENSYWITWICRRVLFSANWIV
jgi:hypothetical protein